MIRYMIAGALLLVVVTQERDAQVRIDRKEVQSVGLWIYNDLTQGVEKARKTGKPLLVVFR